MNGRKLLPFYAAVLVIILLSLPQMIYVVDETNQVIITRLGEYKRTAAKPGLHFRIPIMEQITRFDKRILTSDALPAEYLSLDKKRTVVDHVSRWRIVDPLLFYKTVRDVAGARARLDDIVFSEMRRALAAHEFVDIISSQREPIMEIVTKRTRKKCKQFGIDVVDVRVKRADLPVEVQASVFARMAAERSRIAKRYRSEGSEEVAKIKAKTDKERTIILAEAYEKSQKIKGDGDSESTRIYADAYGKDPAFYQFVRSLEAYEKMLPQHSSLVLSSDSELLQYLGSGTHKA